jgi:hypothetical protein
LPDLSLERLTAVHQQLQFFGNHAPLADAQRLILARSLFHSLRRRALQEFYTDLLMGKRPKLVLKAPPQHGKLARVREITSA